MNDNPGRKYGPRRPRVRRPGVLAAMTCIADSGMRRLSPAISSRPSGFCRRRRCPAWIAPLTRKGQFR